MAHVCTWLPTMLPLLHRVHLLRLLLLLLCLFSTACLLPLLHLGLAIRHQVLWPLVRNAVSLALDLTILTRADSSLCLNLLLLLLLEVARLILLSLAIRALTTRLRHHVLQIAHVARAANLTWVARVRPRPLLIRGRDLRARVSSRGSRRPVSYTHLTLPTTERV